MICDHSKSIGQYVLSGPFVAVHFIACGERRAKLACTARRYKQVYCYRRVAKNILLYSLYWENKSLKLRKTFLMANLDNYSNKLLFQHCLWTILL